MGKTPIFIDTSDSANDNYKVAINVDKTTTSLTNSLEINGDIKGGDKFYVNDIIHERVSSSSYKIKTNLGGSSNRSGELRLTHDEVSLIMYDSSGNLATFLQLYPEDLKIYHLHDFSKSSDDRLKSYETDVTNATDMVMKMKPKFYKKHPDLMTDNPTPDLSGVSHYDEYGFIAQELNEDPKLSHFVNKHPKNEIYHVNYIEMIPILVKTIKELNERIKVLESRL